MSILPGADVFIAEHIVPRAARPETMLSLARLNSRFEIQWYVDHLRSKGIKLTDSYNQLYTSSGCYTDPTSKELFSLLGVSNYEDLDIDPSGGCTSIQDLNGPLPEEPHERYDFVFEHGTLEHIFDVKTALSSVTLMTKIGGWFCHISPINFLNHGFYSFSLNIFDNFYRLNGFTNFQYWLLGYNCNDLTDQNLKIYTIKYYSNWILLDPALIFGNQEQFCVAVIAQKNLEQRIFLFRHKEFMILSDDCHGSPSSSV